MIVEILRKIGGHTLIYSAGSLASGAIGFLMIPFYTHFLVAADYGLLELLDLTTFVVGSVVGLGLNAAIFRFYAEQRTETSRHEVISTALLFGVSLAALVYVILFASSPVISAAIFKTARYQTYLKLGFLVLCLDTVGELALSYLRSKQQSVRVTLFSLARLSMGLTLNVYFIAFLGLGVWGVLYSGLVAGSAITLALVAMTFREVGFSFSRPRLVGMLRYGVPLIPMTLGLFVLNYADRFFLQRSASLSEVGIYALGYKLGMVSTALIVAPFLQFWAAYMYEVIERPDGPELIARLQVYFTFILITFTLALSLLSGEVLRVLSPPQYWSAARVVPIVGLAYVFMGLSHFFRVGLYYTKQTKYLGYAVGSSALLNFPLNLALIPTFQAMGAALATLVSFALLAFVMLGASQRMLPIQYQYGRIVKLIGAGAAVYGVAEFIRPETLLPAVATDLLLLGAFPGLLFAMAFYEASEIRKMREIAYAATRRFGLNAWPS